VDRSANARHEETLNLHRCSQGLNRGRVIFHLPSINGEDVHAWDLESIAELTAEYRRQMPSKGGYSHYQWFKRPGHANHRLDCSVLCLAGLALSRLRID
jgi:phage terminase large subunit GpA-like protein